MYPGWWGGNPLQGHTKRPLVIKLSTAFFILAPFLYLSAFAMAKYGSLMPTSQDINDLTPTSWLVLGGSWVAALSAWSARKVGLYAVVGYCAFTVGHNIWVLVNGHDVVFPQWLVLIAQFLGLAGISVFLHREVRAPYLNPRICWWRTSPRYRVAFDVEITTLDGSHKVELLDVSKTGCFVTPYETPELGQPVRVNINQLGCSIEAKGELIRLGVAGRPGGGLVEGAGIRFGKLDRKNRAAMQTLLAKLSRATGDRKAPTTLDEIKTKAV